MFPVYTSHILIVISLLPLTILLLSKEKQIEFTDPVCPDKVFIMFPELGFQMFMNFFSSPLMMICPSLDHFIQLIFYLLFHYLTIFKYTKS
jgi:hypothetical protein